MRYEAGSSHELAIVRAAGSEKDSRWLQEVRALAKLSPKGAAKTEERHDDSNEQQAYGVGLGGVRPRHTRGADEKGVGPQKA